eukprot:TRINITY_DN49239_c0_g1_i1.p1 TRINITY_DN49239_c0_g1~~TRINITY_DN49239_c0_g1_i1.p1  ORF type:complete len:241 (+),score=48.35 TRINITY_DN49239_c0_g1_i1:58-780(+)
MTHVQAGHDANKSDSKELTLVANGPPLDYSFKELRSCAEIETEDPRSGGKRTQSPELDDQASGANGAGASNTLAKATPLEPKMRVVLRKVTTSVKLNNNMLEYLAGLPQALETMLPNARMTLQWLDISFNQIAVVSSDDDLLQFKNLKALYMHGNCISKFSSVERLRKLPKLISLTLNGNPIEANKCYRSYVIGALPQLKSLDHSTITEDETKSAIAWFQGHLARAKKRKEDMEAMADAE